MERERDGMNSLLNKKRKRQHLVMAREHGWDMAYEDDMSLGDEDKEDSVGAGTVAEQL